MPTVDKAEVRPYPTDDVVVVCKMRFALSAAVDAVAAEVDVVGETHGDGWWWTSRSFLCGSKAIAGLVGFQGAAFELEEVLNSPYGRELLIKRASVSQGWKK